jgi:phosphate transport system substrate-binding protein
LHSKRLASLTCAALLAGCVFGLSGASAATPTLTGAGSTLAAPIIFEWDAAWGNATGNAVNYSAVGSGTGFKDISQGLVDFGASDAPLSSYSNVPANLIQIPWALSAVGVGYNLPGIHKLHLTGPVVAAIYLGQITNWDNSAITRLNPGVHLPNLTITPIHRSDGSGTTYAFANYLSDISSTWRTRVGYSTTLSWPVGPGGSGNSGVVAILGSTPGGISYNEVAYLITHKLPAAAIKNAAGNYEYPNLPQIETAARIIKSVPANREMHIVNPPRNVKNAYPITTYTYAFVPTNAPQGGLLRSFINYALTTGQSLGPRIDFAPIPNVVLRASQAALGSIN